ncbi:MAG: phosphatidate cytidylyltransferase [Oscillospiraceae bacterium]|nr:phosphatidate cytidylyltransferase [Oscillospiraceae bacterium]
MKTRILTAVVAVPVLFVVLFFLPPIFLAVLTALLCAVGALEFIRATAADLPGLLKYLTAVFAALLPLASQVNRAGVSLAVMMVFLLCLFGIAIRRYEKEKPISVTGLLACLFAGLLYPTLLGALNGLKGMENGHLLVLLPIVVTFCCDSSAYFAGVYLGKHKVTPLVSPHKSAEGFVGGILGGILLLMLYGGILALATELTVNFGLLAVYGLLGSLACELGDLSYSLIKRQCGVKDYGNLIPGHGGVLDRFDSMSFVAPVLYAMVLLLPAIH